MRTFPLKVTSLWQTPHPRTHLRAKDCYINYSAKGFFKNSLTNQVTVDTQQFPCWYCVWLFSLVQPTMFPSLPYTEIVSWRLVYKFEKYCLAYEIMFGKNFLQPRRSGHMVIADTFFRNVRQPFWSSLTILGIKLVPFSLKRGSKNNFRLKYLGHTTLFQRQLDIFTTS